MVEYLPSYEGVLNYYNFGRYSKMYCIHPSEDEFGLISVIGRRNVNLQIQVESIVPKCQYNKCYFWCLARQVGLVRLEVKLTKEYK